MDNKAKPFDLVLIESPYEYEQASLDELRALKQLAIFCRQHQIPVRAHDITVTNGDGLVSQEDVGDTYVGPFFMYCDYRNGLDLNELGNTNSSQSARILVTGGLLAYDNLELERRVSLANLNPDHVANYEPEDPARRFAIVKGCVAKCADFVSRRLTSRIKKSEVLIDTESAVTDGDKLHPLKTYIPYPCNISPSSLFSYYILEILDEIPAIRKV